MHLTFYMFNEQTTEFDQALDAEKTQGVYQELGFRQKPPFDAKAFLHTSRGVVPDWVGYVSQYLNLAGRRITNTSNSLVVLIKQDGRIFATTKGYGYTALNRSRLEKQFGLKVVLNAIDPNNIRMIDTRANDLTSKQKRELLSKESPLYEFDFDFDTDLLKLISGAPSDEGLAKRLSGSDSLKLSADTEFGEIGQKCQQLYREYKKDSYKENFPFVDYLKTIEDEALVQELDNLLVQALNTRQDTNLLLVYPEMLEFDAIDRFRIVYGQSSSEHVREIDLQSVYGFLGGLPELLNPQDVRITGLGDAGQRITQTYTLYEFCVYEVDYLGRKFLLSLENWFEISPDYIAEIDEQLKRIEEVNEDFMPAFLKNMSEGEYNRSAAETVDKFSLMDKQNYPAGGHSKIEVCDLLSSNAEFICVKKYNGSSTLSHLFSQGVVSSQLLAEVPEYREFVLGKAPNFTLPITKDQLDRRKITFIFAIIHTTNKRLVDALPFFSKVNLRNAYRQIVRLDFHFKLCKVPVVDAKEGN